MAAILLLVDFAVVGLLAFVRLSSFGVMGDLMLVEVGVLTVLGGVIEFSRSKGVYEFRRLTSSSEEEFSTAKHMEASRKAVVLFSAALTLFLLLVALALLE